MSRYHAYLRNAAALAASYDGSLPLAIYLRQFFAAHKKFGSSDRKAVGGLTHQYFRAGHVTDTLEKEEGLLLADLLCNPFPSSVLNALRPEWSAFSGLPLEDKLNALGMHWDAAIHSPWVHLLQQETDPEAFCRSHFIQPDLFLRIRPGKELQVKNKLSGAGIPYRDEGEDGCIRLANGTRLDHVLSWNAEAVVQDKNSQRCGAVIRKAVPEFSGILWDVCAASGGKSLMLYDLYRGKPKLVVSDIRPSILHNLKERFSNAGITGYKSFVCDFTKPASLPANITADMVLVDAPCTGSGTWARTPEQHYFFKSPMAEEFSRTQFAICSNALKVLKPGGIYIYITCSVFACENQAITRQLQSIHNLQLLHNEVLDGTLQQADSMYIAIFRKP